jgi:integrase
MAKSPSVNFYLKPVDADGLSLIYLQFWVKGDKLHISFDEKIKPADWSVKKQRGKNINTLTSDGEHLLNDLLDNLEKTLLDAYKKEKVNGIPTVNKLKGYLDEFMLQNKGKENATEFWGLIARFISGEIKFRGKKKAKGSLSNYHAVKTHLEGFQTKKRYPLNFESVTLDFFHKYTSYLYDDLKLARNTVAKDISILKVFMGEAVDLGLTGNLAFRNKKFSVSEEETDAVYLTEEEIIKLWRFDLSSKKKLEQVRDLFVFGCLVGLRFSDFSDIQPENIVNIDGQSFIKVRTKKTQETVIIPCDPIVLEIFRKYDRMPNKLPKSISNQKFNDYIKDALEDAKFDAPGRLESTPELLLYQCVSSHTARRSFATNYYLQGFPTIDLMKITGHKTEKAFLKYIRVSKLDSAKRLAQHMKKKWSEKMLRVAS